MNKQCLIVVVLLATCFAQLLVAQNAAPAVQRGIKLSYGVSLPNGSHGKIPIRIRLTRVPAVPAVNDESFNVSVTNGWDMDARRSTSTSAELIMLGGRTSAEVELLFDAKDRDGCTLLVERGSRHTQSAGNDLFQEYINDTRFAGNGEPSWLLISSNAPSNRFTNQAIHYPGQPLIFPNNPAIGQASFAGRFGGDARIPGLKKLFGRPLTQVLDSHNWHALPPAELPESWIGLTSVDYVLISNDELQSLAKVPAYRKIIEQWVAAGGCLIVFNATDSLAHAASVFPALLGAQRAQTDRQWAAVDPKEIASFFETQSIYGKRKSDLKPAKSLEDSDQIAVCPYLDGTVAVIVSPEKLSRKVTESDFPIRQVFANHYVVRNSSWQSPIPGVGKPPIALFGVFTGIFLFLIGPVILMVVSLNNDRRYLFFLVPVLSFVTCASILGYAIVADFNKQLARTDTVTNLDSQAGYAFSRASSAYYCGSQPSHYAYDTDTLVQTTVDDRSGYRIRQLPDENQLSSPRIAPRKLHEVFTAKPHPTGQRFLVTGSADQSGVPQVTNLLGSRIEKAFFKHGGKAYLVRDLSPKQTAEGIEMPLEDCHKELLEMIADRKVPGELGFFSANFAAIKAVINEPQAGTFVAVVDFNPAVEPLIEPFNYKLQLHVVHGKYN